MVMYSIASCTNTASNSRPEPQVRMSPVQVLALGVELRETASISSEMSTRVIANRAFRWNALLPPPLPSSSTVRVGPSALSSSEAANAASSAYSGGAEINGHQTARSP